MKASRSYRAEFQLALELLARACTALQRRGVPLPVLVGGAVVEFDTGSGIATGDFDLVTPHQEEVEAALLEVGFLQEDRAGWKRGGLYHPDHAIGVEFVSGQYFDGLGDRSRIRLITLDAGVVPVASTEDLIADRMGQWEASGRKDAAMLHQAAALLALAEAPDEAYLDRRIREETAGGADLVLLRTLSP